MKCPNCKTEMEISNGVATCPKCGARYRVKESDEETDEIRQPVQNVEMANEPEASEVDEVQELKRRLAEMEKKQAEMENRESNGRNFASKLSSIKSGKVGEFFKKWGLKVILPSVLALILIISLSVSFAGIRGIYIDEKNPAEFISFGPSDFELHSIDAGEEIVDKGKWKKKGNTIYLTYQDEDFGDVTEELTIKGFSNKRFTVVDEFETETTYKRVSLINFKNLKKKTKVVFINDGKETVKKVKVGTYLNMDEELEKDGYVFMGWYTSEEGWKDPNAKRVRFPQRIWEKATYFANWKDIRDYKININGVSEELTAKEGDLIYNAIKATENDGYIYKYSYFDNGKIIIDENTRMPAHDISVSREKIGGAPIKIMLDAGDGVLADDKQTITIEYGNWETYLPIPEKEDYTFTGWKIANTDKFFTDENGKTNRWYDFENYDKKGLKLVATYVVTFEIEGTTLKKYNGKDTNVIIPDGVTNIGDNAFSNCKGITSITIPASITNIGKYAFYECKDLTNIAIPDSVTSIGESAFRSCRSLASVTIGNGVTSIGFAAFNGCTSLTSIIIPNSVMQIGSYAFDSCNSLTNVTIGNSVASIGNEAFYNCPIESATLPVSAISSIDKSKLKTIVITNGEIPEKAFYECLSLTNVTICDDVTSIGKDAFSGCTGLASVIIGKGITDIGSNAFRACPIGSATIPALAIAYIRNSNLKNVTITIGEISQLAFSGNTSITNVTVCGEVSSIGHYAFEGCTGLTEVIIEEGVESIGSHAFSGCSSLEKITIPFVGEKANVTMNDKNKYPLYPLGYIFGSTSYAGGVATEQRYIARGKSNTKTFYYIPSSLKFVTVTGGNILPGAFYNCKGIISIIMPDNLTSIEENAFYNCTGLTNITIPDSVTKIGISAFYRCTGLTGVTIPDNVTKILRQAFFGCVTLDSIKIGTNLTYIGHEAFWGCKNITSISIPSSVINIESSAFNRCSKLESISVEPSNTKYYSINNCLMDKERKALILGCKNSVIPRDGSVEEIGESAFAGCTGLEEVIIPDSVKTIGGRAFVNTAWYDKQPDGMVYAGRFAYAYKGVMSDNTSITLKEGTIGIVSYAFSNSLGLTSVTIPASVKSISKDAFSGCKGLTNIIISNGITNIDSYAFRNCEKLASITYSGTIEQWNAINKGSDWNYYTGNYVVHCTDGDISKANS